VDSSCVRKKYSPRSVSAFPRIFQSLTGIFPWYVPCLGLAVASETAKRTKAKPVASTGVRAPRFPVHARVRYRADDGPWHEGWTENMSRSGLLLHVHSAVTPNTPLDLVVELPGAGPGVAPGQVVGRGRVVETIEDEANGAMISAEFTDYTFGRPIDPTLFAGRC
jgi:hypothetical protein